MRSWAYLAGKLAVAAAPLYGLMWWLGKLFPPSHGWYAPLGQGMQFLLCDLALLVWFLLCAGALSPPTLVSYAPLGQRMQFLLCDLPLLVWFLLCAGALYAIVWDQRRRCRVCLRRLRMPVETGSWGYMQIGRAHV